MRATSSASQRCVSEVRVSFFMAACTMRLGHAFHAAADGRMAHPERTRVGESRRGAFGCVTSFQTGEEPILVGVSVSRAVARGEVSTRILWLEKKRPRKQPLLGDLAILGGRHLLSPARSN